MANEITMVGIAGASGSGKSVLAQLVAQRLSKKYGTEQVVILQEDSYYRSRDHLTFEQREQINYDHPEAIEHSLLVLHLQQLRQGSPIDAPQYDYAIHNRKRESLRLKPPRLLVVEGILVLHDQQIRSQLDLSVFVDVPLDICLARRLDRDVTERGRTSQSVLEQFQTTVRPMYFQFVEPTRQSADIIVPGGGENLKAIELLNAFLETVLDDAPAAGTASQGTWSP